MTQFRKKPIVIEATQWFKNGDHPRDGADTFTGDDGLQHRCEGRMVRYYRHPNDSGARECGGPLVAKGIATIVIDASAPSLGSGCGHTMHNHGWIDTKEGGHVVCPGDWIITGVKGEVYPCKPDIFAATYEPV